MIDHSRTQALFRKLGQLLARSKAKAAPDRVHQVRTCARRLESLLEIYYAEPTPRVRKALRGLKRVRRSASAVRDLDVQMMALRKLKIGREMERKARLMQVLSERRAECADGFLAGLTHKRIRKLRRRLERTAAEIEASVRTPEQESGSSVTPVWVDFDPLAVALRNFASDARKFKPLTADNLHEFRTACKRNRYLAEMRGADPEAKRVIEQLKRIQDASGDWHDWLTLTSTAEHVFSHDGALIAALHNVTQVKFHEARDVAISAGRELLSIRRRLQAQQAAFKRKPNSGAMMARAASAA